MDPSGIYDSQVQNETSSEDFVLHLRLPSLQEMAYNQIAIAVWYRYYSTASQRHYEPCNLVSIERLELLDCHKLMKTLTMPRFMEEILKKHLKRVRRETIRCVEYFRDEILSSCFDQYRIRQVDWECFAWCPDGIIDFKSTAIKMLHSHKLTEVQKFAIMCNFCLENEIKIFDLNRLPMETFISKIGDPSSVLFYWISYLKNNLHSMNRYSILSPDHYDIFESTYYMSHGTAFEYFWNQLSSKDQTSFIRIRLYVGAGSLPWRQSLFYKMSHDQLTNLLFGQPVAMIYFFIEKWEMPEWAIMAWKRCKNRISNQQFVQLLESLLDRYRKNLFLHRERKMSVLLEIWNTANDGHKNYAAEQPGLEKSAVHLIMSATNSLMASFAPDDPPLWKKLAPSSFKFLLKFLSLKSAEFRKNLILQGDLSFIFNFDFNVVDEIFELCLPNFQGEVEFKNERSKYVIRPYFCEILYSEEDHDELNRRLLRSFQNLNISSNDVLKKIIESLITANKTEYETYYPSNDVDESGLMRLSKFINKILQENVSAVLNMKQSYISSLSHNSDPYERYCSLNELSKLIEQEFVHEHLQLLKHRLVEKLKTTSVEKWVWCVYKYEKFTRVFSWCFENEEEMFVQVERCIPINSIVVKVLEEIARVSQCLFYYITSTFNNLERFLEWYFSGVAEKVISFKLAFMNDPESTKILEYVQKSKWNQQLRREFLQWNWPV